MNENYRRLQPNENIVRWKENSCFIDVILELLLNNPKFLKIILDLDSEDVVVKELKILVLRWLGGKKVTAENLKKTTYKIPYFGKVFIDSKKPGIKRPINSFGDANEFLTYLLNYLEDEVGIAELAPNNLFPSLKIRLEVTREEILLDSDRCFDFKLSINRRFSRSLAEALRKIILLDDYDYLIDSLSFFSSYITLHAALENDKEERLFHYEDSRLPPVLHVETPYGIKKFFLLWVIIHTGNHYFIRKNQVNGKCLENNGMCSKPKEIGIFDFGNLNAGQRIYSVQYMSFEEAQELYDGFGSYRSSILEKIEPFEIGQLEPVAKFIANSFERPRERLKSLADDLGVDVESFTDKLSEHVEREKLEAKENPNSTWPLSLEEFSFSPLDSSDPSQNCTNPSSSTVLSDPSSDANILKLISSLSYFMNLTFPKKSIINFGTEKKIKVFFWLLRDEKLEVNFKNSEVLLEYVKDELERLNMNPNYDLESDNEALSRFREVLKKIDPYVEENFVLRFWHLFCDFLCYFFPFRKCERVFTPINDLCFRACNYTVKRIEFAQKTGSELKVEHGK
ncbi:MAG: hypothetical protein LBJ09_01680 [Clostridiales bacterium]|nr:hypothetical protein [Clostridiales bacterium]